MVAAVLENQLPTDVVAVAAKYIDTTHLTGGSINIFLSNKVNVARFANQPYCQDKFGCANTVYLSNDTIN